MAGTWIKAIEIEEFRRFRGITIDFDENVTLIAGQNGTSKSTLLGMLAQPFSFGVRRGSTANQPDSSTYTDNYHSLVLTNHRDLSGQHFMYDCDDVFRLSKEFDANTKTYKYWSVLEDVIASQSSPLVDGKLFTRNRGRDSGSSVRFVTGPGPSHKPGEGNFPHPVIYLGLNRLWPLAEIKTCTFPGDAISSVDRNWYVDTYNEVLCLDEHDNSAQFMDTPEKRKFVTPKSSDYDGESCSAGQDNLGQLLTAILSFRHLKKDLGSRYRGGLLLIDEVDATLHAFAQEKLLRLLCDISNELDLQIVATTHSLRLLEVAFKSPMKQHTRVLYLSNVAGAVEQRSFDNFEDVSADLKLDPTPPAKRVSRLVSVVLEDESARDMFHHICGASLRGYITVKTANSISSGDLKNIGVLTKKLPELEDVILVADGDMGSTWSKPPGNLLVLPGDARPETLIYRHLYSLPAGDPFWGDPVPTYSRQYAISRPGGSKTSGENRTWVKKWFSQQSKFWGKQDRKAIKAWVSANKTECRKFTARFIKKLSTRSKKPLPSALIARVLSKFN